MLELNAIEKTMAKVRGIPGYHRLETFLKGAYIAMTLRVFGAAFDAVTAHSPECRKELADWEEGRRVALGVLPKGPHITLEKQGHVVRMIGTGLIDPHVAILFKNLDSAMMVYTTYMGVTQALCENRVLIRGDNSMAMETNRILDIIMTYLLPRFVLNHNFRRPPKFAPQQYVTMLIIYASFMPALVRTFFNRGRAAS
jgi:hypothetical protein